MIFLKKVLVTGAAGCVGVEVIKYLLSEGKYEITALDLKNRRTYLRLKKYKRRINIIYGDINDRVCLSERYRNLSGKDSDSEAKIYKKNKKVTN